MLDIVDFTNAFRLSVNNLCGMLEKTGQMPYGNVHVFVKRGRNYRASMRIEKLRNIRYNKVSFLRKEE